MSILFPVAALTAVSCTQPAPSSGFLEKPERMTKSTTAPFQLSWKKLGADFTKHRKIEIIPVSTQHTRMRGIALEGWDKPAGKLAQKEIKQNADSLKKCFINSFKTVYPERWKVGASQSALRLELHLVEIAPSQPLLEAGGFLFRGGGLMNQPSIAIEGRLREPSSGEIIATFADRRKGDFALVDISKLQTYKMHRNVMDQWARQTVIWLSIADGTKVPRPLPIKLITW